MSRKYPICANCGGEIDPTRYDGCESYYITKYGPLCRECFIEQEEEYLRLNTEEFAALVGAQVVRL